MVDGINKNMIKRLPDFNKWAYWILYFMAAVSLIYSIFAFVTISLLMGFGILLGAVIYFALAHYIKKGNVAVIITAIVVLLIDNIFTYVGVGRVSWLKILVLAFIIFDFVQKKYPKLIPS